MSCIASQAFMDSVLGVVRFLQAGIQTNWFGLACPHHCGPSSFSTRPCCLPCWCALLPVVWTLPQPLDFWLQPPLYYLTAVRGRLPSCCSSCPLPVTCCGCECQTPTSSSLNWNFRGWTYLWGALLGLLLLLCVNSASANSSGFQQSPVSGHHHASAAGSFSGLSPVASAPSVAASTSSESRAVVLSSFPEVPQDLLRLANRLSGSRLSGPQRVQRAWTCGCWQVQYSQVVCHPLVRPSSWNWQIATTVSCPVPDFLSQGFSLRRVSSSQQSVVLRDPILFAKHSQVSQRQRSISGGRVFRSLQTSIRRNGDGTRVSCSVEAGFRSLCVRACSRGPSRLGWHLPFVW